ncbi:MULTISPECIES: AraC family transcriptional regulator [unclassified Variovorax]|uniref:helix-turn-helix transcriptional regulator n=1 Tax=unclassified Variovorax TaxID=663243 RepID=UPI0025786447|nr:MULTISPECIES: AraC family transcriptional regulator [unclassified Variovorax]MDM0087510.1 AraC family transcriptional regulator [Variovorax sp. J22G40]MDM0144233.1 AraC family transcriptional regulator [Variovorax sp. J2P1-31]
MTIAGEADADIFSAPYGVVPRGRAGPPGLGFAAQEALQAREARSGCPTVDLGGMSFMRIRGGSVEACQHALIGLREKRRTFSLQLLAVVHGELTAVGSSGRSLTLAAGDMALLDAGEGTSLLSLQPMDAWVVDLSEAVIARWLHPLPAGMSRLAGDSGWGRLLSTYLRNWAFETLSALSSSFEKELIGEHVMSLLSLALAQGRDAAPDDAPVVSARDRHMYLRMRQWVRDNHADPEFGVAALAARFGASTRHVHRVFARAGGGESFLDAVRHDRLDAAARLLRDAMDDGSQQVSVAEIAARCGFSDPGYFGRVFRKKYGHSPSEFAKKNFRAPR